MGGVGPWRFPSSELDHGGEVFTFSPSPKGAPSCSHDEMEDACPLAQGGENVEGSSESEACRTEVLLQAPKAGGDGCNVGARERGGEGLQEPGGWALGLQTWPRVRNTERGSLEHSCRGPSGPGSGRLWFLSMWQ